MVPVHMTDLDLHCFQKSINPVSAIDGSIKIKIG